MVAPRSVLSPLAGPLEPAARRTIEREDAREIFRDLLFERDSRAFAVTRDALVTMRAAVDMPSSRVRA